MHPACSVCCNFICCFWHLPGFSWLKHKISLKLIINNYSGQFAHKYFISVMQLYLMNLFVALWFWFFFTRDIFCWEKSKWGCCFVFCLCLRNLLFIGLLSDCQTVLVELLVAMVSQRITAEELALLIRLFLEKTPPIVNSPISPSTMLS